MEPKKKVPAVRLDTLKSIQRTLVSADAATFCS